MGNASQGSTEEEEPVNKCQWSQQQEDSRDTAVIGTKEGGKGLIMGVVHNSKGPRKFK